MKRKMIAWFLTTAMAAVLMVGCRAENEGEAVSEPTPEETQEAVPSEDAENAENTEDTGDSKDAEDGITLNVFAAASMTETLEKIQEMYAQEAPNVDLVFNFDSSGTLKTQIQEGAECDLFISAAQKQMDQMDIQADPSVNEENLDFVLEGSRVNLLENKVVLAVPDGNPAGIESFEDLGTDKLNLLALGNEDVPVGQYSTEILTTLGLLDSLEADGKITYGSNVKEVTTQVSEAAADAGIIYATDAYSANLSSVAEAGSDLCSPAIYPAAVLNISEHQEEAQAFLDYLQTDACMAVFEEVGFIKAE